VRESVWRHRHAPPIATLLIRDGETRDAVRLTLVDALNCPDILEAKRARRGKASPRDAIGANVQACEPSPKKPRHEEHRHCSAKSQQPEQLLLSNESFEGELSKLPSEDEPKEEQHRATQSIAAREKPIHRVSSALNTLQNIDLRWRYVET
jgi:hypothetical protein